MDEEGRSTLHVAVAYRQVETVRYLVAPARKSSTAPNDLPTLVSDNLDLDKIGGAGVDPNHKTSYGSTALEEAEIRHLKEIVDILKPLASK
ncbi:unnamed protein product [Dibothriocephalus latus]|uniref:Uncharacterized protein n=1 Tax=Dibothriocephalus latus TaxID=60516 RepID=A0A3P6PQH6_DIBLA|nr:unnamed protein product [Dibothriocephalus latus]